MSDKNFKVKNGIDAVGPITISPSSNSIDGLIINTPTGGKSIRFIRNGTGEVGSIDEWGGLVTSGGIQVVQPWYTRSPGIEAQSFFWAGTTTRSAAGFGGTATGTNPVIYISSHGAGTNDLTQWLKPDNTVLAKVDYLGSIYNSGLVEIGRTKTSDGSSAINFITVGSYTGAGGQSTISRGSGYNGSLVLTNYGNGSIILNQSGTNILTITNTGSATFSSDLTVTGNLTVNGTTTNLNSTNLIIEDKNIIIADVATPSDTTADGAGITVKGATDKTFSWSNSTKSFISSEPLIINSTYSTTVGLIVQAATGQTSTNIFEVQRAGGGDPSFTVSHNYINLNRNTTAAASLTVYGANSGAVPLYVIGRSSQSVDLQQWQNSSGQVIASISSTGGLSLNYANSIKLYNTANTDYAQLWMDNGSGGTNLYVKTNYPVLMGDVGVDTGASLTVATQSTGQVGQVIRAKASQTADLQQWQNSSGTVLSSISSNGNLVSNLSGTSTTFPIFVYTTSSATTPYGIAIARQNRSDQYIHIHESDGSKAVIEAVAPNAAKPFFIKNKSNEALYLATNDTNRFSITSTGLIGIGIDTPSSAQMTLINSNSANTGLIVKGAASQTANLTEWQDSAGTLLVRVRASGQLNVGGAVAATTLGVLNIDPAWPALKVLGAVSQTANLQEWQNSSGTLLGSIASDGTTTLGYQYLTSGTHKIYGVTQILNNASGTSSLSVLNPAWSGNSSFTIGTTSTDNANNRNWQFVAGGGEYAGQSGNYIGEGGLILFENNPNDSSTTFRAGFRRGGQFALNSTFETYSANLSIKPISTSTLGIVIRANSSQTANLQEWQDSGGTTLAYVKDNGYSASIAGFTYIYTTTIQGWNGVGGSISFANASPIIIAPQSASTVVLAIKGAASQSANMQEWQNNSGTVLAKIDKDGIITVPAINVVGQSISSNTTMIAGYRYFVDTSASRTLTLPSSATIGDEIQIFDSTNTAGTNNITINSNNGKIEGVVESYIIDVNGAAIVMTYTGSTYGWKVRM